MQSPQLHRNSGFKRIASTKTTFQEDQAFARLLLYEDLRALPVGDIVNAQVGLFGSRDTDPNFKPRRDRFARLHEYCNKSFTRFKADALAVINFSPAAQRGSSNQVRTPPRHPAQVPTPSRNPTQVPTPQIATAEFESPPPRTLQRTRLQSWAEYYRNSSPTTSPDSSHARSSSLEESDEHLSDSVASSFGTPPAAPAFIPMSSSRTPNRAARSDGSAAGVVSVDDVAHELGNVEIASWSHEKQINLEDFAGCHPMRFLRFHDCNVTTHETTDVLVAYADGVELEDLDCYNANLIPSTLNPSVNDAVAISFPNISSSALGAMADRAKLFSTELGEAPCATATGTAYQQYQSGGNELNRVVTCKYKFPPGIRCTKYGFNGVADSDQYYLHRKFGTMKLTKINADLHKEYVEVILASDTDAKTQAEGLGTGVSITVYWIMPIAGTKKSVKAQGKNAALFAGTKKEPCMNNVLKAPTRFFGRLCGRDPPGEQSTVFSVPTARRSIPDPPETATCGQNHSNAEHETLPAMLVPKTPSSSRPVTVVNPMPSHGHDTMPTVPPSDPSPSCSDTVVVLDPNLTAQGHVTLPAVLPIDALPSNTDTVATLTSPFPPIPGHHTTITVPPTNPSSRRTDILSVPAPIPQSARKREPMPTVPPNDPPPSLTDSVAVPAPKPTPAQRNEPMPTVPANDPPPSSIDAVAVLALKPTPAEGHVIVPPTKPPSVDPPPSHTHTVAAPMPQSPPAQGHETTITVPPTNPSSGRTDILAVPAPTPLSAQKHEPTPTVPSNGLPLSLTATVAATAPKPTPAQGHEPMPTAPANYPLPSRIDTVVVLAHLVPPIDLLPILAPKPTPVKGHETMLKVFPFDPPPSHTHTVAAPMPQSPPAQGHETTITVPLTNPSSGRTDIQTVPAPIPLSARGHERMPPSLAASVAVTAPKPTPEQGHESMPKMPANDPPLSRIDTDAVLALKPTPADVHVIMPAMLPIDPSTSTTDTVVALTPQSPLVPERETTTTVPPTKPPPGRTDTLPYPAPTPPLAQGHGKMPTVPTTALLPILAPKPTPVNGHETMLKVFPSKPPSHTHTVAALMPQSPPAQGHETTITVPPTNPSSGRTDILAMPAPTPLSAQKHEPTPTVPSNGLPLSLTATVAATAPKPTPAQGHEPMPTVPANYPLPSRIDTVVVLALKTMPAQVHVTMPAVLLIDSLSSNTDTVAALTPHPPAPGHETTPLGEPTVGHTMSTTPVLLDNFDSNSTVQHTDPPLDRTVKSSTTGGLELLVHDLPARHPDSTRIIPLIDEPTMPATPYHHTHSAAVATVDNEGDKVVVPIPVACAAAAVAAVTNLVSSSEPTTPAVNKSLVSTLATNESLPLKLLQASDTHSDHSDSPDFAQGTTNTELRSIDALDKSNTDLLPDSPLSHADVDSASTVTVQFSDEEMGYVCKDSPTLALLNIWADQQETHHHSWCQDADHDAMEATSTDEVLEEQDMVIDEERDMVIDEERDMVIDEEQDIIVDEEQDMVVDKEQDMETDREQDLVDAIAATGDDVVGDRALGSHLFDNALLQRWQATGASKLRALQRPPVPTQSTKPPPQQRKRPFENMNDESVLDHSRACPRYKKRRASAKIAPSRRLTGTVEEDEQKSSTYSDAERSHYEVLGVERNATASEIKKAYRNLALQLHPDKNIGNDDANAQFLLVQQAYMCLSDAQQRQLYDDADKATL